MTFDIPELDFFLQKQGKENENDGLSDDTTKLIISITDFIVYCVPLIFQNNSSSHSIEFHVRNYKVSLSDSNPIENRYSFKFQTSHSIKTDQNMARYRRPPTIAP